ncbi:MAG: hypothetical protein IPO43_17005 [Rhodoferax sp.]|nr:hypothetical protein [Rhodoferax sp.]
MEILHPRHCERSAAIHVGGALDNFIIAGSESDTATQFAFHEPVVIANAVKQSMAPKYMDRHGLRPRNDDPGSRSVCGSDPEQEARNDGNGLLSSLCKPEHQPS